MVSLIDVSILIEIFVEIPTVDWWTNVTLTRDCYQTRFNEPLCSHVYMYLQYTTAHAYVISLMTFALASHFLDVAML